MKRTRELTKLEHALLGYVGNGEASAYTIRQVFTETGMSRFSSSPGSIYPALRRLTELALLTTSETAGARGRSKRLYELSERGEIVLKDWLVRDLTFEEIVSQADILMLRFSFMEGRCSIGEMRSFIGQLRKGLFEQIDELEQKAEVFRSTGAKNAELTLQAGLMMTRAHIHWTQLAVRSLDERSLSESCT